jgi:Universal stress protein family/ABC-2 type transporter
MDPTPKIERILFATDLSHNSNNAFRYAMTLANLSGARITVLHAFGHLPPNAELLLTAFLGLFIAVAVSEAFVAQTFINFFRFPMILLCGLFFTIEKLPVFLKPLS